jgi:hypothetical protein
MEPANGRADALATTITFESLAMECGWDVVRVYDGPSFSSPLLGVFSGLETPTPLVARATDGILVHMFSDYNWALDGYKAHYVVERCPGECSGHGTCIREYATCVCEPGWTGERCDVAACPAGCANHGVCRPGSAGGRPQACVCMSGWTGRGCQVQVAPWMFYANGGGAGVMPERRTEHALVYRPGADELWVFGGRDQERGGCASRRDRRRMAAAAAAAAAATTGTRENTRNGTANGGGGTNVTGGDAGPVRATAIGEALCADALVYSFAAATWEHVSFTSPAVPTGTSTNDRTNTGTNTTTADAGGGGGTNASAAPTSDGTSTSTSAHTATAPDGRYGHTAVVFDDRMFVFGGRVSSLTNGGGGGGDRSRWSSPNAGVPTSSLWMLDLSSRVWSTTPPAPPPPPSVPPAASDVPHGGNGSHGDNRTHANLSTTTTTAGTATTTATTATTTTSSPAGNSNSSTGGNHGNQGGHSGGPASVAPVAVFGHTAVVSADGIMHILGGLDVYNQFVWQFLTLDLATLLSFVQPTAADRSAGDDAGDDVGDDNDAPTTPLRPQWRKGSTAGAFPGGALWPHGGSRRGRWRNVGVRWSV